MRVDRWERLAAGTGILFVATVVASQVILPAPPKLEDLSGFTTYIADHHRALQTQAYLGAISIVFGVWFFGTVRAMLRRAEGGEGHLANIAYGGALVALSIAGVCITTFAAVAFRTQDQVVTRALLDIGTIGFAFLFIPLAGTAFAVALAAWRTGVLPKWYAGLSALFAAAGIATGALTYGTTGSLSLNNPTGVSMIPTISLGVWVLVTSVLLMVGEAEAEAVSTEGATVYHWHLRRASSQ